MPQRASSRGGQRPSASEVGPWQKPRQGYFDSPGQISPRPGNYWLTVVDTSNAHNFTLQGPNGLDMDITLVSNGGTPAP